MCDVADEHLVGWAYWQFKYYEDLTTSAGTGSEGFYNQDGSLQEWKAKALARSSRRKGSDARAFLFSAHTVFFKGSRSIGLVHRDTARRPGAAIESQAGAV